MDIYPSLAIILLMITEFSTCAILHIILNFVSMFYERNIA